MRVAIGGLLHESNTFNPTPTGLSAFTVDAGDAILPAWSDTFHEVGGFIEGASRYGFDLCPVLVASATPSGKVTAETFEVLVGQLLDRLAGTTPDGLLLALHGAMVSEDYPDADGEVVRRLRAALGPDFPLVVTHDFHANVSEQIVRDSTALVIYKTNPHLDQRARGLQAAYMIARTIRGEVRPVQALRKPPMLLNIVHHNTNVEPLRHVMQAAEAMEQDPSILAASVAAGYQYADVYEMGPSSLVVTDGRPDQAGQAAEQLAQMLWAIRPQLEFSLPDAAEAVRQARQSVEAPVVLVEMGDNIGGGSAGDATFILSELLRQGATGWVSVLADAEAAQACARAGVGTAVRLSAGGKRGSHHGYPVEVHGRVKCLHDGKYTETQPRHGGQRFYDQGLTAVLEIGDPRREITSKLVLTTHRQVPFSLYQLLSLGIEPQQQKILVVKAAIAFRAAYEPIAAHIIQVDTPGLTAVNPARFTYGQVRRPLWGLDDLS